MKFWPVRTVTGEARRHSREAFPHDIPLRVTVAAMRPDACVVHIAYIRPTPSAVSDRFFSVRLADLAVTTLDDSFFPDEWAGTAHPVPAGPPPSLHP